MQLGKNTNTVKNVKAVAFLLVFFNFRYIFLPVQRKMFFENSLFYSEKVLGQKWKFG